MDDVFHPGVSTHVHPRRIPARVLTYAEPRVFHRAAEDETQREETDHGGILTRASASLHAREVARLHDLETRRQIARDHHGRAGREPRAPRRVGDAQRSE